MNKLKVNRRNKVSINNKPRNNRKMRNAGFFFRYFSTSKANLSKYSLVTFAYFVVSFSIGCDTPKSLTPAHKESFIKLFGGQYDQQAVDILPLKHGFLLVGNSTSAPESQGSHQDILLIETDLLGNEIWSEFYDIRRQSMDMAAAMSMKDDYLYIGGTTFTGELGDAFLLTINLTNHQIEQITTYGWAETNEMMGDLVIYGDEVLMVGTTNHINQTKYPIGTQPNPLDVSDAFWLKTDLNGHMLWSEIKRSGFQGRDSVHCVVALENGKFAIAGATDYSENGHSNPDLDILIFQIDEHGNEYAALVYGDESKDEVSMDITLQNGQLALTGWESQTSSDESKSVYMMNVPIHLENATIQSFRTVLSGVGNSISFLENGNILLAGTLKLADHTDMFLAEMTLDGAIQWKNTFGWSGQDFGIQSLSLEEKNDELLILGTTDFGTNYMMSLVKTDRSGKLIQ